VLNIRQKSDEEIESLRRLKNTEEITINGEK